MSQSISAYSYITCYVYTSIFIYAYIHFINTQIFTQMCEIIAKETINCHPQKNEYIYSVECLTPLNSHLLILFNHKF